MSSHRIVQTHGNRKGILLITKTKEKKKWYPNIYQVDKFYSLMIIKLIIVLISKVQLEFPKKQRKFKLRKKEASDLVNKEEKNLNPLLW